MASAICSAPSRPIRASRSESFVKPETSANTSVPGMTAAVASGATASRRSTIRGT